MRNVWRDVGLTDPSTATTTAMNTYCIERTIKDEDMVTTFFLSYLLHSSLFSACARVMMVGELCTSQCALGALHLHHLVFGFYFFFFCWCGFVERLEISLVQVQNTNCERPIFRLISIHKCVAD